MMKRSLSRTMPALIAGAMLAGVGHADVVTITPSKDNTMFESATGALSSGAGDGLYCGLSGSLSGNQLKRALVHFDIAGNVPAGSTINSVTLHMLLLSGGPGTPDLPVALHRAARDWGEGKSISVNGAGAAAATGDATWIHTFYSNQFWSTPGGNFVAAESASSLVGWLPNEMVSWSSAQLTADVQSMLDNPATNYGWVLRGDESFSMSARRFYSREAANPDDAPMLEIDFTLGGCLGDTNGDGQVNVTDLVNVILDWDTDGSASGGDVNDDGIVNVTDLVTVILEWGPC